MSDITAARPASGASIESSWGGEVHDQLEGMQSGVLDVAIPSNANAAQVTVVFPKPYASKPVILSGNAGTNLGANHGDTYVVMAEQASATGFVARAWRTTGTLAAGNVTISWLALGKLA